jgi:hypothetical protein
MTVAKLRGARGRKYSEQANVRAARVIPLRPEVVALARRVAMEERAWAVRSQQRIDCWTGGAGSPDQQWRDRHGIWRPARRPPPRRRRISFNEDCCGCMSIVVHKRLLDMRWTPKSVKTLSV